MPASEPAASTTPVTTLRRGIVPDRLGAPAWSAFRLRLLLVGDAAQTALQVVEDEPDRRLGGRGRGDRPLLVADDEDTPLGGCDLELGQLLVPVA